MFYQNASFNLIRWCKINSPRRWASLTGNVYRPLKNSWGIPVCDNKSKRGIKLYIRSGLSKVFKSKHRKSSKFANAFGWTHGNESIWRRRFHSVCLNLTNWLVFVSYTHRFKRSDWTSTIRSKLSASMELCWCCSCRAFTRTRFIDCKILFLFSSNIWMLNVIILTFTVNTVLHALVAS